MPKSIDNDVLFVDKTFGFDSADLTGGAASMRMVINKQRARQGTRPMPRRGRAQLGKSHMRTAQNTFQGSFDYPQTSLLNVRVWSHRAVFTIKRRRWKKTKARM